MLDTVRADRKPMWLIKKIHSLELFGTFTNRLIEAVGGYPRPGDDGDPVCGGPAARAAAW